MSIARRAPVRGIHGFPIGRLVVETPLSRGLRHPPSERMGITGSCFPGQAREDRSASLIVLTAGALVAPF